MSLPAGRCRTRVCRLDQSAYTTSNSTLPVRGALSISVRLHQHFVAMTIVKLDRDAAILSLRRLIATVPRRPKVWSEQVRTAITSAPFSQIRRFNPVSTTRPLSSLVSSEYFVTILEPTRYLVRVLCLTSRSRVRFWTTGTSASAMFSEASQTS